ncbi:hypothetical protein [Acetivibrio cellulolyticus]|uniref:hypothetical protein n=1 Tax=Acetivibrio cellulolyticus TaxID=35830 RepID=UPI0001E300E0|nr:hypothetical protein [Acetivibrio cellulolyticus]
MYYIITLYHPFKGWFAFLLATPKGVVSQAIWLAKDDRIIKSLNIREIRQIFRDSGRIIEINRILRKDRVIKKKEKGYKNFLHSKQIT